MQLHLITWCREMFYPGNASWCQQMETFFALLALCEGNSPVTGEFLLQRLVTRSFDVFLDNRLSKPSRHRWFETPPRSLVRHCNVQICNCHQTSPLTFILPQWSRFSSILHSIHYSQLPETGLKMIEWCKKSLAVYQRYFLQWTAICIFSGDIVNLFIRFSQALWMSPCVNQTNCRLLTCSWFS